MTIWNLALYAVGALLVALLVFNRKSRIYASIVLISALISIYGFEYIYGHKLNHKFATGDFSMVVYDEWYAWRQGVKKAHGWANPGKELRLWIIDKNNEIVFKNRFRTNKQGYISWKNYEIEKRPNEYRIVFLGDSMTGTTTMSRPWVDIVEELLNVAPDKKNLFAGKIVRTYNMGIPGSGFRHFKKAYEDYGKAFKPDLVIVNYTEGDYSRAPLVSKSQAPLEAGDVEYITEYALGKAIISLSCETKPITLRNPDCYFYRNFPMIAPASIIENPEAINDIKERIIRDYLSIFAGISLYPYHTVAVINKYVKLDMYFKIKARSTKRSRPPGEAEQANLLSDDEMIGVAKETLKYIRGEHSNVLILQMPLFWNFFPETMPGPMAAGEWSSRLVAEGMQALDVRKFLPIGKDKNEVLSWYNLPHDGHMSDKGGRLYAKAVTRAIIEQLQQHRAVTD